MGRVMNQIRRGVVEASPHIDTAGPAGIVSFSTDMASPAKSLVVGMEPIQDLHGYDNPWPAGGGKNLFQTTATTETVNDVKFTVNADGTVTASGTASKNTSWGLGTVTLAEGNYIASGGVSGNALINVATKVNAGASDAPFSVVSGGETLRVNVYVTSGTALNVTFKPMIRFASVSDATFAPYENLCPISGRTGVTVERTGKNLLPNVLPIDTINATFGSDGTITSAANARTFGFPCAPNTSFTFSQSTTGAGWYVAFGTKKPAVGDSVTYIRTMTNLASATANSGANTYIIVGVASEAVFETLLSNKGQIELGSTASNYSEFIGTTYPVTWQSEAGTVYGGTVDLVSGVLTVTDAEIASYNSETLPSTWISDRDVYAEGTTPTIGAQVVYELATPQTYQLTPQQIQMLKGANVLWSDADSVTVKFWTHI